MGELLERPNNTLDLTTTLPIIDLSSLEIASQRSSTLHEVHRACKELGFFQVINHGIPLSVLKDALDAAREFFDLPIEEKMLLLSENVYDPVRYGSSTNHTNGRNFIKHYSHPISNWIHLWPSNPPSYREKIGKYAKAAQILQKQLMEAVFENLGLERGYLKEELEQGFQVMISNNYPACPEPEDRALAVLPHTDHGTLTILLQTGPGLQIMDQKNNCVSVPFIEGALIVLVGNQLEVMSNGRYESVVHQVTMNRENKRFTIASFHSLAINKKVGPVEKLVDEEHLSRYEAFSFKDFLGFTADKNNAGKSFIDSVRKRT